MEENLKINFGLEIVEKLRKKPMNNPDEPENNICKLTN